MDNGIFDQLDRLRRGGRVHRDPSALHNAAAYNWADAPQPTFVAPALHCTLPSEPHVEDPLVLDSFDQRLLEQPDPTTRHGQAVLGRARLSLPSAPRAAQTQDTAQTLPFALSTNYHDADPRLPRPRSAWDPTQDCGGTSSPFSQHITSSPTFNASQRHAAPYNNSRFDDLARPSDIAGSQPQSLAFRANTADALQHETCDMQPSASQLKTVERAAQRIDPIQRKDLPPAVQGISLVSTRDLSDRFRAVFPFPIFNAVQSKCFNTVFNTSDNLVVSAPTGSGKTAVFELAICRLINSFEIGSFKIVYQAPTKSLCSERYRDWSKKFAPLDLQCAELTGDTETTQLRNVQRANIIIATPEKWDSVTRKWKDHQKLMQMVKLFLIDEVHMLKEDRGATLEAVVSRMKSVESNVRFVALSATVPNSQDIALWLGKDPLNGHIPAVREKFGEEFRPVRLEKYVCGYHTTGNDFAYDKILSGKLPDIIKRWSQRKPIMVFCFTRSACVETATTLAEWWLSQPPQEQYWNPPRKKVVVADRQLRDMVPSGVAFHHAGLTTEDRAAIEKGYLEGDINVICCTSTLAVGVNLPCHMVIIKNTVTYQANAAGCKEYSDLEVMQMLGRAGRPQFDNTAVAIIMTRLPRVPHYQKMVTGQEVLESCLHLNLIDHLNAEIGLGTVTSVSSAKKWLTGTFLYVRLKENPDHYQIDGVTHRQNLDDRLETICRKAVAMLSKHNLASASPGLRCTEFGDAMARYYVRFDTMKTLIAVPRQARISEVLSTISQASEFKDIRFRAGEKTTYKDLNKNHSIKFPIPVNLDASAHKVSLIMQSVLGGVELGTDDQKQRFEYNIAKAVIFQHAPRLVRCIIDCQLHLADSVAARNALMLARSISAQVWDDSPLHMKQLEQVGLVTVRKLVAAGISSIEELETVEAQRIERALSRNPPYGSQIQVKARAFPKLRVSIRMAGEPVVQNGEHVKVRLLAEIGFLNDTVPETFHGQPIYVCFLADTSDGRLLQFARTSSKKLNQGQDIMFEAKLTSPSQSIRAFVMCENLAGTSRHATHKPNIPSTAFPPPQTAIDKNEQKSTLANAFQQRISADTSDVLAVNQPDEFNDEMIDDADLARAELDGFVDIDELESWTQLAAGEDEIPPRKKQKTGDIDGLIDTPEPVQLANGKWACNHHCKDKTTCKHLCCREGLDKKPKPPKAKSNATDAKSRKDPKQTHLRLPVAKKVNTGLKGPLPTGKGSHISAHSEVGSKEVLDLRQLHGRVQTNTPVVSTLRSGDTDGKRTLQLENYRPPVPTCLVAGSTLKDVDSDSYGGGSWDFDDLPDMSSLIKTQEESNIDDEMLDVASDIEKSLQPSHASSTERQDNLVDLDWFGQDENVWDEEANDFPGNPPAVGQEMLNQVNHGDALRRSGPFLQSANSSRNDFGDLQSRHSGVMESDPSSATLAATNQIETSPHELPRRPGVQTKASEHELDENGFAEPVRGTTAKVEAHQTSPQDDMEKWFHEYLGSELFHYTG